METSENLIIIGDRVLIKPKTETNQTKSGLYLPPGVKEKEEIQSGYVVKTGPGYAVSYDDMDEPWKMNEEKAKYIPLQVREGDLAIFLLKAAFEIVYQEEKYYIVPQSGILMLERDENLLNDLLS
ncbi:MAG: co-chaperone GroES [Flavobacteriaceae bacterium]|jgi:co-chaperonin GroES (HSP10)|nr:co-chaperone GroES [Flavobacteriaceae bacterium]